MNGTSCNSSNNNSCEDYNDTDISSDNPYNNTGIFSDNPYDYEFVIFCLASFLGTTGNGLVIWFCLFRMEKTVNVIWFLNLSIADFLFALVLAYITVERLFLLPVSDFIFTMIDFVYYVNMVVSVLQLTVISVDRCICVVFPVWCRNHRTRRLALIVVLIIWVISISTQIFEVIEIVSWYGSYKWMLIARFIFFFLLPFIVIISSYTILILRIKGKSIIKSSRPFKIIVAVVIAFFICWFPYYLFELLWIIPNIIDNDFYEAGKICEFLMLFNCCINPILYVFIGQDFKHKCCCSFLSVFEKVFREDMDPENFMEN